MPTLKKKPVKKTKEPSFEVVHTDAGKIVVNLKSDKLANACYQVFRTTGKRWELRRLGTRYDAIKQAWEEQCYDVHDLKELLDVIKKDHEKVQSECAARIKYGQIIFEDIETMFKVGMHVAVPTIDGLKGGIILQNEHQYGWGERFTIVYRAITGVNGAPQYSKETVRVPFFDGQIDVSELPLRLTTDADKAMLTARGAIFKKFVSGSTHCEYTATVARPSWFYRAEYRADGRVMVDAKTFRKIDPEFFSNRRGYDEDDEVGDEMGIKDGELWMCSPTLYGFSFAAKKWGELRVDALSPAVYAKTAWTSLVMEPSRKETLLTLVQHNDSGFQDVVANKGGGCVFLLHGPPGVGKTLTAEALAEEMGRPLYAISVGELGTDPVQLEASLRTILEMASIWKSVILLDEADVFLESRDEHNILRNAMVGIFLRLMEYHQGIIFLTTNRVKKFDHAFQSRISLAIHYPEMTQDTRAQVWTNLLNASKITHHSLNGVLIGSEPEIGTKIINPRALAETNMNGRQIKNSIRLAQALAASQKRSVGHDDLERMISMTREFQQDFKPAE